MQHGANGPVCKLRLQAALQNFDGTLDGAKLAVRKSLEFVAEHPVRHRAAAHFVPPSLRQAKRKAAAVVGIGRSLDEPGANQGVDRSADGRSASRNGGGNLVQGRRLLLRNRLEKLAPRRLSPLRGTVLDPPLGNGGEARRQR